MTGNPVAMTNLSNPSPRIIFRKTRLENLFCSTLELLRPSNDTLLLVLLAPLRLQILPGETHYWMAEKIAEAEADRQVTQCGDA
jgi:hypothetical protein